MDPSKEAQDVVFGHTDDLCGHQSVRRSMDRLHRLGRGGVGEAEHGAIPGVEPVRDELHPEIGRHREIGYVCCCHVLGGGVGNIVTIHEEGHIETSDCHRIVLLRSPAFHLVGAIARMSGPDRPSSSSASKHNARMPTARLGPGEHGEETRPRPCSQSEFRRRPSSTRRPDGKALRLVSLTQRGVEIK